MLSLARALDTLYELLEQVLSFRGFTFARVRVDCSWDAKSLKHTPLFHLVISCLALFLGESGDSGRGPGLEGEAKLAIISPFYERFLGRS
jgi:hypothetical protein